MHKTACLNRVGWSHGLAIRKTTQLCFQEKLQLLEEHVINLAREMIDATQHTFHVWLCRVAFCNKCMTRFYHSGKLETITKKFGVTLCWSQLSERPHRHATHMVFFWFPTGMEPVFLFVYLSIFLNCCSFALPGLLTAVNDQRVAHDGVVDMSWLAHAHSSPPTYTHAQTHCSLFWIYLLGLQFCGFYARWGMQAAFFCKMKVFCNGPCKRVVWICFYSGFFVWKNFVALVCDEKCEMIVQTIMLYNATWHHGASWIKPPCFMNAYTRVVACINVCPFVPPSACNPAAIKQPRFYMFLCFYVIKLSWPLLVAALPQPACRS